MNNTILFGVIALAVVGLLIFLDSGFGPGETLSESAMPVTSSKEAAIRLSASLFEQGGSGQNGTVTLAESEEGTVVVVKVENGQAGVSQPAHFHRGSCDQLGGIVISLNPVVDGFSETQLNISAADFAKELPLPVNVHKSEEQLAVYVACGELRP